MDVLGDDLALELGKHAQHLEHGLARRRAGIETLLVKVQIHPLGLQLIQGSDQVVSTAEQKGAAWRCKIGPLGVWGLSL